MDAQGILEQRLANQGISSSGSYPEDILKRLGAMQAQDYPAALWAIGLRCKPLTRSDVEAAVVERKIARTWLMRGTLHFAPASDMAWMLKLFSPRLIRTAEARDRHLGLSDGTVKKTRSLFRRALGGGKSLTRSEMYQVMEKGGVPSSGNLGYHMLYRAAWDGLICFGPHSGKEPTFVLAEGWLPRQPPLSREEALGEIVARYFTGHGPATIRDFAWWSGLTVSDAKLGMERAAQMLKEEVVDGAVYYMPKRGTWKSVSGRSVHLLPAFDEYLLGYADRTAVMGSGGTKERARRATATVVHSNGVFLPILVVEGTVAGVWKRSSTRAGLAITLSPFRKLSAEQTAEVTGQVERYGRFFGTPAVLKT